MAKFLIYNFDIVRSAKGNPFPRPLSLVITVPTVSHFICTHCRFHPQLYLHNRWDLRHKNCTYNSDTTTASTIKKGLVQHRNAPVRRKQGWSGTSTDVFSSNCMITKYSKDGMIEDARQVFDKMLERNVISWTSMIAGYFENGKTDDASQLFDQMPERDVVSWTTMIAGYARNGRIEDARHIFNRMPERNLVSWTAMIAGYAQNGMMENALELFDKIPERTLISWNALIAGCVQNGEMEYARQLFEEMPERNVVSWTTMIAGYVHDGRLEDARSLFDKMPTRNVVSWTAMISGYTQYGRIQDARQLFDRIPQRDIIAWSAMITGYVQNGYGEEALILFRQMKQAGIKPNQSTFTSVLSACAILGALENGKQVHERLIKTGFMADVCVQNALITMYARSGSISDSRQTFDKMPERELVSWNAIIVGHAQHGHGKEATGCFDQMQLLGIKPDHITFIGVLSACSHAGLVDEGWQYFDSMSRDFYILPQSDHYACMVDLLGRSGHLYEAVDLVNKMPFEPNSVVWVALLDACRVHFNIEIGKWAAERLFELKPLKATTYVLLSNIYAMFGRRLITSTNRHHLCNAGENGRTDEGSRDEHFYASLLMIHGSTSHWLVIDCSVKENFPESRHDYNYSYLSFDMQSVNGHLTSIESIYWPHNTWCRITLIAMRGRRGGWLSATVLRVIILEWRRA
eukprot:Gb_04659 [translate_table: standard]